MSMNFVAAGPLSTIQDGGRFGYQSSGFPPSGAADLDALYTGNILVGNRMDEAAVEMTMRGSTIQFSSPCVIALTGADNSPFLNGEKIPMYTAVSVSVNDYLHCGYMQNGCRTYLCVSGGFDIDNVLGSKSTTLKLNLGGIEGRKICQGDSIKLNKHTKTLRNMEKRIVSPLVYLSDAVLDVISGPQNNLFSDYEIKKFYSSAFTVTPASDRMGIRLSGAELKAENGQDIVSDGISTGCVQVPNDGNPIILLSDRQTTGGYAKIAAVVSSSLSKAAQLVSGNIVRFNEITLEEAHRLYKEKKESYMKLDKQLNE